MADSVVGLMIDSDKIRAVELEKWRGKHPRVIRAGEVRLPPTAFMNGAVADPDAVSSAMKVLWRSEGFTSKRVIMSVDGRQAIVRRSELPAASPDALRRAAGFDIEELLSYPLDEAIFDLAEIGTERRATSGSVSTSGIEGEFDDVDWVSILVIAIDRSTRQSLFDVVVAAGLKPVAFHLASESLMSSVVADTSLAESEEQQAADELTAIVSVGAGQTDVVIHDPAGTLFSRTLTVGVGDAAFNVADELESQLEGLSGYRSRPHTQTATERRTSAEQAGIAAVVEGVSRTLAYYQSELDTREVNRVALIGPKAEAPGLQTGLAASLGPIVYLGEPRANWLLSLGPWYRYATALGAVMCESRAGNQARSFSLVPWEDQERLASKRRLLVGVGAALLVAAGMFNVSLSLDREFQDREAAAEKAELDRSRIASELAGSNTLLVEADMLQASLLQADAVLEQRIRFPAVLQELAEAMPTESQLVSIQMRRTVNGEQVVGYVGSNPVGVISLSALTTDLFQVGSFVEGLSALEMSAGFWLNQSAIGPVGTSDESGALFSLDGAITSEAQGQKGLLGSAAHGSLDGDREGLES